MHIKYKNDGTKDKNDNIVFTIGKGVIYALLISLILILIYSILLSITEISESTIPTITTIIVMISISMGGIISTKNIESRGWLIGIIIGSLYMLILFLIGLIIKTDIEPGGFSIFKAIMGMIIGALSGIVGINLSNK